MSELYPYQWSGVDFLARRDRAYLADEMGLGKTVQAIVAASHINPGYVCVVCPASVQENWRREWKEWYPHFDGGMNIVSYAKLIRQPILKPLPPDSLVILDEAHYCKSPGAKRTRAALQLAAEAERAWLLSGTPMPNDPRELWPIMKYLWPEIPLKFGIRTAYDWMDKWCVWTQSDYGYRVWGTKPEAKKELGPLLKTFMLRRRLSEVALDLPPLRTTVQYLDRDPRVAEEIETYADVQDNPEHMSTLRRLLGEYKAPKIARILVEELQYDPDLSMVVLYHHKKTGEVLRKAFYNAGIKKAGFDGSTPALVRQAEIDTFQEGKARVFLAQQEAAGTGITLTRASEIVLVEPSWSPAENDQAIKRIHRIGQTIPCRARLFAVPDSLDEALVGTLARKTGMVREVVDG